MSLWAIDFCAPIINIKEFYKRTESKKKIRSKNCDVGRRDGERVKEERERERWRVRSTRQQLLRVGSLLWDT